jgi:hypothetical protein
MRVAAAVVAGVLGAACRGPARPAVTDAASDVDEVPASLSVNEDTGVDRDSPDVSDDTDASDGNGSFDISDLSDVSVAVDSPAPVCPIGQARCDDGCIAAGGCCGLPPDGVAARVEPSYDDRRAAVSARAVVSTDNDNGLYQTSALVAHEGRLWFGYPSHGCRGFRAVSFAPSAGGVPAAVESQCEPMGQDPVAVSIVHSGDALLGCALTPSAGPSEVRCGRWSGGPGTWAQEGPARRVNAAHWIDGADPTTVAWNVPVAGGSQLAVARFDRAMALVGEQPIAAPSGDAVTGDVLSSGVRWLLRQPVSRVQAPILERLDGDSRLPPIDLADLGRFNDWQGALAADDGGVALMVQSGANLTLIRPTEAGVRGRVAFGGGGRGQGALLPFEGGWLYAGALGDWVVALRMDCAGRLREPPINLWNRGSGNRFASFARGPDGRGYWALFLARGSAPGLQRSVVEFHW